MTSTEFTATEKATRALELIADAQDSAAGHDLDELREAYRLVRDVRDALAMALVTIDRQRASIGAASDELAAVKTELVRAGGDRDRADAKIQELEGRLAAALAERDAAREAARRNLTARDAAADRIAEMADERDALIADRDAAVARLDAARTALGL